MASSASAPGSGTAVPLTVTVASRAGLSKGAPVSRTLGKSTTPLPVPLPEDVRKRSAVVPENAGLAMKFSVARTPLPEATVVKSSKRTTALPSPKPPVSDSASRPGSPRLATGPDVLKSGEQPAGTHAPPRKLPADAELNVSAQRIESDFLDIEKVYGGGVLNADAKRERCSRGDRDGGR
jgi:hypothetical protein